MDKRTAQALHEDAAEAELLSGPGLPTEQARQQIVLLDPRLPFRAILERLIRSLADWPNHPSDPTEDTLSDIDREQIRRDAERITKQADRQAAYVITPAVALARHCLALLTELEQAEQGRATAHNWHAAYFAELGKTRDLEARLAKTDALAEALTRGIRALDGTIADLVNNLGWTQDEYDEWDVSRSAMEEALAAWETE